MPRIVPSVEEQKRRIRNAMKKIENKKKTVISPVTVTKKSAFIHFPKAVVKNKTSPCGCKASVVPNFNMYTHRLMRMNKKTLPDPASPSFNNKVKQLVRTEYSKNYPRLPKLNNNSLYMTQTYTGLRKKLEQIKKNSIQKPTKSNQVVNKSCKPKVPYTKTRPGALKKTKKVLKDMKDLKTQKKSKLQLKYI